MASPRIGSLCSGYGGLDLGVQSVLGGTVAWHCQHDPDDKHQYAAQILAHHWPEIPNHGDITTVDYSKVEPIDILTAGFPCQDVSFAGLRAGIAEGTRSGLWRHVARAIKELRPRLVVIENVRGLLSAKADRGLGSGDPDLDPATGARRVLRALGAVLGDLADLGFDAEWQMLRASDIGAPHQRERVFLIAWPAASDSDDQRSAWAGGSEREPERHAAGEDCELADAQGAGLKGPRLRGRVAERGPVVEDADGAARGEWRVAASGQEEGWGTRANACRRGGVPDAGRRGGSDVADPDRGEQPRYKEPSGGRDGVQQRLRNDADGCGEATADTEGLGRGEGRAESEGQQGGLDVAVGSTPDWGTFGPAVRRWELVLGRPAPRPTDDRGRLSPAFVEWMMGLPSGHVVGIPGLSRAAQIKALGNGVVPQQARAALQILIARQAAPEARA